MKLVERIDKALYPAFSRNWDDAAFRERILTCIKPEHDVLDLGAGAGIIGAMNFKGLARRVCGVDLDARVESNPMLDEGKRADANSIPYGDNAFDVVFSDNVLEHLAEPEKVFAEVHRVLKPGGVYLAKTPNKWHYVPLIARATPHWFHVRANKWRGRAAEDVFPTLYRANSKSDIGRLARDAGFEAPLVERIEGRPEYLRFAAPAYLVGAAYERLVNAHRMFASGRVLIICQCRKPGH